MTAHDPELADPRNVKSSAVTDRAYSRAVIARTIVSP